MGIQINGSNDTIQADDGSLSLAGSVSYEDVTNVTSVGLSTFSSGIHIDDSITHLGDTDTKIRFPAADTVTVETGGNERVRVTSAGNFGIGVTPNVKLQVKLDTNKHLYFQGNIGEIGNVPGIQGVTDAGSLASLGLRGSDLRFATGSSERVRIDSSGRLLVGPTSTSTPGTAVFQGNSTGSSSYGLLRLTKGSTSPSDGDTLGLVAFGDSNHATAAQITCERDGGTWNSGSSHPTRIEFNTTSDGQSGSSERMRIDSSGRMALGVTNPQSYLSTDLVIGVADYGGITLASSSTTAQNYLCFADGTSGNEAYRGYLEYEHANDAMTIATAGNERIRIDSSGRMGLGETSPASNLVVKQSGSTFTTQTQTVALFQRSSTTGHGAKIAIVAGNASGSDINFGDTDDEDIGKIQYLHTDNSFRFTTNTTEQMIITSSGQMGLGTNNPVQQAGKGLHIHNSGGQTRIKLTNNVVGATANDGFDIIQEHNNDVHILNHENGVFKLGTNDAERMRIDSSGRLLVNTTSATGTNKLQVSGSDALIHGLTLGHGSGAVSSNAAFGQNALLANTTGNYNTAIGNLALDANTTGAVNSALGYGALGANTTGGNNIAIGYATLGSNVSGGNNVAIGNYALDANTTSNNTAVGYNALGANAGGTSNVAVGRDALANNTSANFVTGIGVEALYSNTSGAANNALGYQALRQNTTGDSNSAFGNATARNNTTGANNSAFGMNCLRSNSTGNNNTAFGSHAAYTLTGNDNDAFGYYALHANTSGTKNSAIGRGTLRSNTTGSNNAALGYFALHLNSTGSHNVAMGHNALYANTASNNTALGNSALAANTSGGTNTAVGDGAATTNTTGYQITSVGHASLYSNTTGYANAAVGYLALQDNNTGYHNAAMGAQCLLNVTSGIRNTGVGFNVGTVLTTGSYNVYLGAYAQASSSSVTFETVIGHNQTGKGTGTAFIDGSNGVYNRNNTSSWNTTSDRRIKKNIVDNNEGLSIINQIAVKNFDYKTAEEIEADGEVPVTEAVTKTGTQIGIIAQELQEVRSSWVITRDNGTLAVTGNDEIVWHLVNAVKELSAKNTALEARIASLEA